MFLLLLTGVSFKRVIRFSMVLTILFCFLRRNMFVFVWMFEGIELFVLLIIVDGVNFFFVSFIKWLYFFALRKFRNKYVFGCVAFNIKGGVFGNFGRVFNSVVCLYKFKGCVLFVVLKWIVFVSVRLFIGFIFRARLERIAFGFALIKLFWCINSVCVM